ncbi:BQ5605_C049g12422 [Microbotryum silenes-dioicae]|uniref:BQ5605_C049g12422 protein n=1 Tax=Microbotryum silenes-dioicae TaxID=796604 RepID=A0A2X0MT20_9BASI|nr:BQ5605_C049g12422 [Microbotryum silenes-dioicae]
MSAIVAVEPVTSGTALLKTSVGEILIELWPREAPKACRNFVQLAMEGYYDDLPFHRIVPGFIAQTGDATGTGTGGESIYDEGEFEDEFSQRLKFNRRGLLGMANQGRNTNLSQFFFTLDRADELYQRNTLFARVAAGDTLFNVLKIGEVELEPGTDRPVYPPKIHSIRILDNPFEDIVPRITPEERKEQDRAKREMRLERAKQKQFGKRKGTKNKALLSFGAEPEEEAPIDPDLAKAKFKSAHDVLDDGQLSKEVIDDRGTSATLPDWMQAPTRASAAVPTAGKRKEDEKRRDAAEELKMAESTSLRHAKEQKAKAAANPTAADKVRDAIAKVQADLKRMTRDEEAGSSDEDERETSKAKKPKRSGPSLLQLEREKYQKAGALKKGRGKPNEDDMLTILDGFKSKLKQARPKGKEKEKEKEIGKDRKESDERYGIDEDDDSDVEDWMSHKLVFRKDATLDQHTIDEYSVVDPLAKETASLAELQEKKDSKRRYPGDHKDERGGGGGRSDQRSRDSGGRRDGRSSRRDDGGRGGGRGGSGSVAGGGGFDRRGERPEVRDDWKQDRMRTNDLA